MASESFPPSTDSSSSDDSPPADSSSSSPTDNSVNDSDLTPFFPQSKVLGPDYADTGACHCALRTVYQDSQPAWRCIGNRTADIYNGTTGKWFRALNLPSDNNFDPTVLPEDDDQYPANNKTAYIAQTNSSQPQLIPAPADDQGLSIYDEACTGTNYTDLTARLYAGRKETQNSSLPLGASPCYQYGAFPLPIQNVSSFLTAGCQAGFYCPNNTVNAAPEYCTPTLVCGASRLAGVNCEHAQGLFEPLLCPKGNYCPNGGKKLLTCPSGHYCPAGTVEPIPCMVGSYCGEGAVKQMNLIPFGLLIILDVCLLLVDLLLWLRARANRAKSHRGGGGKSWRPATRIRSRMAGYKTLEDQGAATEPTVGSLKRAPTTFLAAADAEMVSMSDLKDSEDSTDLSAFVRSLSRCIESSNFGLSFGFTDLSFQPKGAKRAILSGITGSIPGGALVGVMGGSGAGKSTFVNVLMGKNKNTAGCVRVNGTQGDISTYKQLIGYVPQDDIVLPELTVRENILHSARIRLPNSWTDREIRAHVDTLLVCLELDHVRDSLVGSPAKPVISGGQRKRVSIGMELVAAPMALFLDEPTSGLDATAAGHIMQTLKALSRVGITVVTIIHQPRQEIFESIDSLILLGNGRTIYQGTREASLQYFENAGFRFPPHINPADALMDIITGNGRIYKHVGDTSKESLISYWHALQDSGNIKAFDEPAASPHAAAALAKSARHRGASFGRQLYRCLNRSFLQQYRSKSSFWFELLSSTLAGFLIGLAQQSHDGVFFHGLFNNGYALLSPALDFSSTPTCSLLVGVSIGLIASSPGVKVFGEEKLIYYREVASGHARLPYYLAKTASVLPRIFIGCFHFTVLFALLASPLMSWSLVFAADLSYWYSIYGLATAVSMVARREDGPLLATMASLVVAILSGMAPKLSSVKQWHMLWLWDMSPGRWMSEAYFSGFVTPMGGGIPHIGGPNGGLYNVDMASKAVGFVLGRIGLDLAILVGIGTMYRVIAFGLMWGVNRRKQR